MIKDFKLIKQKNNKFLIIFKNNIKKLNLMDYYANSLNPKDKLIFQLFMH